jgi:hypothetical protein
MRATLLRSYGHSPQITTNFEGSMQELPNGNMFLDWGQQPYFSEDDASGRQIFDAHFVAPSGSYRAYRFPWNAQPPTAPVLAAGWAAGDLPELYASWNGATDVAAWRVLAGTSPRSLTAVGQARRTNFETAIAANTEAPYLEVQPVDASGKSLAGSNEVSVPRHVEIYGGSAFVPPATGFGGLPVGCFTGAACRLTTTITSGATVLSRTGSEPVPARGTGVVYFHLSAAAGRMLARAKNHRLSVTATVKDSSGVWGSRSINLVPYSTAGGGPRRSLSLSSSLSLVGTSDFVNSHGTGGLLTACHSALTPCSVSATITAGGTVIARAGKQTVGAGDLGYVIFVLTSAGRTMLSHAPGNQLGAQVTVASGSQTAGGQIALIGFS